MMSREPNTTRDRVLHATCKLLEKGASDVRMSDVAKAAGISRQALYLHFPARAELLVAATQYLDDVHDVDARFAPVYAADRPLERLEAFVTAWGSYIPKIYGVGKALLAIKDTDEAAEAAWNDRMQAVRGGCQSIVTLLKQDGLLAPHLDIASGTDILWTLMSVRNWEQFRTECGWSQQAYLERMKHLTRTALTRA